MNLTGLGDRAHLFLNQRHNAALRTDLAAKSQEMAAGTAGDMVAHLKGDTAPLADLDRRLRMAEAYGTATREAGNRLSLMQGALEAAEGTRAALLDRLTAPATSDDRALAASAARTAFEDLVSTLNARLGESALFAGTATDGAALGTAQDMLDDIRTAVAGCSSAAEVAARLDTWFDDPAGGFATLGYQGASTGLSRRIDADLVLDLGPRADDPVLRGLLKAAALGTLAAEPGLPLPEGEDDELIVRARDAVLSLAAPLTEMRAGIGLAQSRVEETTARHTARATAWGLLRNEMTQTDPYAAASELEALRLQLETHYELTSRLSSLNLVSFLR